LGGAWRSPWGKEESKHFFFEKKKQKTFGWLRPVFGPHAFQTPREANQKFFWLARAGRLFFQKKELLACL
jgi:hypothetical protein